MEIWGEDHDFDQQIDYVHYLSTDFLHLLSLEVSPIVPVDLSMYKLMKPQLVHLKPMNTKFSLSELYQRASYVIIPNQEVKLTAQPSTGYSFSHWVTGDEIEVSDASNPILIYQSIAYKHRHTGSLYERLSACAITQSVVLKEGYS